nr:PRC-barrel domain-containing protein [Pararhodobacter sp. SW119]
MRERVGGASARYHLVDFYGLATEGLELVDASGLSVAEIRSFVRSGSVNGAVADVGGFLGLGERSIFLPSNRMAIVKVGDDTFVCTDLSEVELKALPEFSAQQ